MMKVPQRFVKLSLMSLVVVDVQAYLTDEILLNRDTKLTPPAVAAVAAVAAADRKCLVVKAEPEVTAHRGADADGDSSLHQPSREGGS